MRILIPLLLLAGVGAAYFALREQPAGADAGAGPAASIAATEAGRGALELERGNTSAAQRAVNPAAGTDSAAAAAGAAPAAGAVAPDGGLTKPVPEPTFANGVTTDPVGSVAGTPLEDEFALKYLNASYLERVQALETLRTIFETEQQTTDKDLQMSFESMKHEMSWLESNLDG